MPNCIKEIPMLFSTLMVQATLAGRKTETRRMRNLEVVNNPSRDWFFMEIAVADDFKATYASFFSHVTGEVVKIKCPYGKPGDKIWVRESFVPEYFDDCSHGYKADWSKEAAEYVTEPKWKPSIHMPKSAARIWLEIEEISCERLRDISDESAENEGIDFKLVNEEKIFKDYMINGLTWRSPSQSFYSLWKHINGADSLRANPWVWVIKFQECSSPLNTLNFNHQLKLSK